MIQRPRYRSPKSRPKRPSQPCTPISMRSRARPRRERQYLAHEWLAAIRRLRTVGHQDR